MTFEIVEYEKDNERLHFRVDGKDYAIRGSKIIDLIIQGAREAIDDYNFCENCPYNNAIPIEYIELKRDVFDKCDDKSAWGIRMLLMDWSSAQLHKSIKRDAINYVFGKHIERRDDNV